MAETRQSINERLKKTQIKGKLYVEVSEKVKGFWEVFPNGRITTEVLHVDPDFCVIQATVWDGETIVATGTAKEFKTASNINKSSFVENCETSAVGRALSFAGIGSVDGIASADEVAHAMAQQTKPSPVKEQAKPDSNDPRIKWVQLYQDVRRVSGLERANEIVNEILESTGLKGVGREDWPEEVRVMLVEALQIELENKREE